ELAHVPLAKVLHQTPIVVVEEQLCGANVIAVPLSRLDELLTAGDRFAGVGLEAVVCRCRSVRILEGHRDTLCDLPRCELAFLLGRANDVSGFAGVPHPGEPVGRRIGLVDRDAPRQAFDLALLSIPRESLPDHGRSPYRAQLNILAKPVQLTR